MSASRRCSQRAESAPTIPTPKHGVCRYSPDTKTWSVPLQCQGRLRAWANRWFYNSNQTWDMDSGATHAHNGTRGGHTYGGGSTGNGHGGQQAATTTSSLAGAYAVLHLLPSAPIEVAEAAHRALIKAHHPDRGGDHATTVKITLAIEDIRGSKK